MSLPERPISAKNLSSRRRAGVLLHITSLPGPGACGTLGADARNFVDFLARCGCSVWQVLPLGPTHGDRSPYLTQSAHAGDNRLICTHSLVAQGWLDANAVPSDHESALKVAYARFATHAGESQRRAHDDFVSRNAFWLEDYVLYATIKFEHNSSPWWEWPEGLRKREPAAINAFKDAFGAEMAQRRFEQYAFFSQWFALKEYANSRDVSFFGDVPIFVAEDSADVWAEPENFQLGADGRPTHVAGVPPDYFSSTGQLWGNPHYDWAYQAQHDFAWWRKRMASALSQFDIVRLDHFRGFEAYWAVPAGAKTAVDGEWVVGPGAKLFQSFARAFGDLPLVAEDLGLITKSVDELRQEFGFPGMRVLQFAFDGTRENPHLPVNHEANSVAYTATHDNDTTRGWLDSLSLEQQMDLRRALHCKDSDDLLGSLIDAALASPACLTILPLQDVLGLDSAHRMNLPGVAEGNWSWRFEWDALDEHTVRKFAAAVARSARTPDSVALKSVAHE